MEVLARPYRKFRASWMKPVILLLLFVTLFTTVQQLTVSVVRYQTDSQTEQTVEANWWSHPIESLGNLFRDLTGTEEVASVLTSKDHSGTKWYITPPSENSSANYETDGMGIMSSEGDPPFGEMSGNEDKGEEAAKMFMAFQYWASQYGVYSGYNWNTNMVGRILNGAGRSAGGILLMGVAIGGHVFELIGQLVYEMLDTFNVFQYILPDSTANGNLLSEWQYNESSNPIMAYFSDWLNFGRWFGYIIALLLFVAGMGLSVLGFRIGKGKGMAGSMAETTKRLLVSVFSLTGAIFMLSGMISMFADRMQAIDDDLGVDAEISGLILDYEGFVTAGYAYDEDGVDIDNQAWNIHSDDIESLSAVEDVYSGSSSQNIPSASILKKEDIQAMNKIAGVTSDDTDTDDLDGTIDYIRNFWNFDSTQLIDGWTRGFSTASSDMASRYGDNSMPYAIYRVQTDKDGTMTIESDGILSAQNKFNNYTIPGGIGGFFRYVGVILKIGLVSMFAFKMYQIMFQSIVQMVKNVIVWLPSGAGLGSIGGLSLLFGAVITMFVQIFIARSMIALFRDALNGIDVIFPSLTEMIGGSGVMVPFELMNTGPMLFGSIFPFGTGVESIGTVALSTILTGALGIGLYRGFLFMSTKVGSSTDQFFTDMASRISGVRPKDQLGSETAGSDAEANGDVSATTDEASENETQGGISENDAEQMGLGGSVLGGIGAGSVAGASDGLDGQATGYDEDVDDSLAYESALGGSSSGRAGSNMAEEEALGGVGDDVEEETETSQSSTSGSETETSEDGSGTNGAEDLTGAQDFNSADEALGGVGDEDEESERERRNLEHVAAEQEVDEDGTSMSEEALTGDYSDMDSEEDVTGIESIHTSQEQEIDDDTAGAYDQMTNVDQSIENGSNETIMADNGDMDIERAPGDVGMNDEAYDINGDMDQADEAVESDAGTLFATGTGAGVVASSMNQDAGGLQDATFDDEAGVYDIGGDADSIDETIEDEADGGSLEYSRDMADQDISTDETGQPGYDTFAENEMDDITGAELNTEDGVTNQGENEEFSRESTMDPGDIEMSDEWNQEEPNVDEAGTSDIDNFSDLDMESATTSGVAGATAGYVAGHMSNIDASSDESLQDEVSVDGTDSIDRETGLSDDRDVASSTNDMDQIADGESMYDTSPDGVSADIANNNENDGQSFTDTVSDNDHIQDEMSLDGGDELDRELNTVDDRNEATVDESSQGGLSQMGQSMDSGLDASAYAGAGMAAGYASGQMSGVDVSEDESLQDEVSVNGTDSIDYETSLSDNRDTSFSTNEMDRVADAGGMYDVSSEGASIGATANNGDLGGKTYTDTISDNDQIQDEVSLDGQNELDREFNTVDNRNDSTLNESVQGDFSEMGYNMEPGLDASAYAGVGMAAGSVAGQSAFSDASNNGVEQSNMNFGGESTLDRDMGIHDNRGEPSIRDNGSLDNVASRGSEPMYDTAMDSSGFDMDESLDSQGQFYNLDSTVDGSTQDTVAMNTQGQMNHMTNVGQGNVDLSEMNEPSVKPSNNVAFGQVDSGSNELQGQYSYDNDSVNSSVTDRAFSQSMNSIEHGVEGFVSSDQSVREGFDSINEDIRRDNTFKDDIDVHAPDEQQSTGAKHQSLNGYSTDSDVTSTFSGENRDHTTVHQSGTYDAGQDVSEGDTYVNNQRQMTNNGPNNTAFRRMNEEPVRQAVDPRRFRGGSVESDSVDVSPLENNNDSSDRNVFDELFDSGDDGQSYDLSNDD